MPDKLKRCSKASAEAKILQSLSRCSSEAGLPDSKQLSTPMMLPVLRSRLPNLLAALGLPICRHQAGSGCHVLACLMRNYTAMPLHAVLLTQR